MGGNSASIHTGERCFSKPLIACHALSHPRVLPQPEFLADVQQCSKAVYLRVNEATQCAVRRCLTLILLLTMSVAQTHPALLLQCAVRDRLGAFRMTPFAGPNVGFFAPAEVCAGLPCARLLPCAVSIHWALLRGCVMAGVML